MTTYKNQGVGRMDDKEALKKEVKNELASVQRILQRWDPIGVIDMLLEDGLPPDEYDSYAPVVLGMLRRGCSREELVDHLGRVQVESMGLGPWPERDRRTADELLAWWSHRRNLDNE